MGSRIFERKERFSIRKLSIGTCSVVLGSLMIMPQVAAAQSAEDDLGGFVSLDSSRQETGTDLSYQVNASPEGTPSGSNVIEPMANSITEPIIEGEADLATEPMTTADLPSHSQEARNASAVTLAETETLATDSLEEDQILEERDYHLVYDRPAAESYIGWERESLPIGNGEMGSKVFGLVGKERIQFNEKTLWSGGPTPNDQTYNGGNIADRYTYLDDIRQALEEGNQALATSLAERQLTGPYSPQYGRYLSFGDVLIDFVNQPKDLAEVTDYNRQLDLNQAVTTTSYKVDETLFTRDHFVSYPDDVAVTHLAKEGQMSLDFDLKLKMTTDMLNGQFNSYTNQVSPYKTGQVAYDQSGILLSGYVNDNLLKFAAYLGLDTDGQVDVLEDRLSIRNASYANLVMSAKTDYAQDPLTNYRADVNPVDLAKATVEKALEKSYDQILQDHVSDHQSLFNRVQLHLQDQGHYDTTNQMLAQYDPTTDRKLEETFFQFGRYLMIASSRDGENHLPANLQGVWNGVDNPPWNSDYHLNVNLQMNYWPVYSANLAESAKPLINFVDDLRYYGRQAAAAYAGIESQEGEENGWLVHTQVTPFGWTTPGWDYYWGWSPASNAWIMQNVYDYYRFTQDKTYLQEKIYPMLKETAKFWNQFLHYDAASDRYVSSPSYSPEHGTISIGNTYDQSLVWQLFHDYIEAAQILDLDQDFVAEVQEKFEKLQPLHINAAGRIKEWYEEDTPAFTGARVEANHRHVSELVGLFPGTLFSKDQPDYLDAARATLNARGDGGTGWSKANKINLWARLLDGNRAHRLLSEQLKHSTLANLWDTHPPFQIDGNFGATSGMVEMLLQSHNGYIAPLAALPDVWADGSVTGLMARGNVQVDMDWKQNTLSNLVLTAKSGGQVVIDYPHIELANIKINGQATDFERVKDHRIAIDTQVGDIITIDHILPRVHLTGLERTGYHSAQLSFTPIEGADRYLIQRTKVTDPSEIVTFTTDQTTFTDDYLVMDQDYRYEVTAVLDGYHLLASDAREIAGIKTILDDRDPSILYGSSFGDWNDPDQYLGTEKYVDITNQAGVDQASTQLSFTFYGSGLEIYGNKASALGHSSVTIDGQKVGQIDQYNTSTTKQALLGRFENLGDGLHEVTIQLNHQSKGRPGERVKMSLDYFKVLGLEQIDPNPPQPLPDPGAEPETPDQPSEPSNPESEAPVTAKGPGLVNEGETFVFDLTADDDNDGYSNQEELMAGSDYQNERSTPAPVTAKGPGLVNEGETFVFDLAADDDNDGYSNQEELMAGSDYQNERSTPAPVTAKGPGLVNEGETFVFDLAADDDNDGYSNQEELMAGSDYQNERSTPAPVTAKGPGLVNEGETFVFDLAADDDNDGYSNQEELMAGSDYQNERSTPAPVTAKGPGLVNEGETFVFDLAADDDNDGYSNQEELIAGSDYQNDRSKPEAMISQNLSLVNQGPANFFDLSGDPDGDGFTNEEELVAGTDYQDPTDYPKTSTLDEAQAEDGEISSFLLNAQDSLVSSRVQKADQARADSPAKEKPNLVNPETSDHLSSNQEGLKSGSQEGDSPVGASQTSKTYANAGLRLPDTGEETLSLIFGPAAMAILGSLGLIAKRKENEA